VGASRYLGNIRDVLDERKAAILQAVVQEYIRTAQPVGSNHVLAATSVDVSAATVRNEMAALEADGYLQQPHTSAGRVPTDKGYRFFVDSIARPGPLDSGRALQVRTFFAHAHGALEQMLSDTSQLLTRLTDHAAVVVGSPIEQQATVRSVQLVGLSSRVVLAVTVLSNGAVERQTIELGAELADDQISAASSHLARAMVGSVANTRVLISPTGDTAVDALVDAAHAALSSAGRATEPIYVGGVARMAEAFDAVETVRSVLRTLEEQYVVVSLVRDILDRGLSVGIGSELGLEQLSSCSVVVAPFEIDGEPAGSIGVVGPTRMNYEQALASVAIVSRRLGQRLSEG
jgi:heat-inducible transcriptional repressor